MSFALLVLSGCNEKKSEPAAVVPVQSIKLSVSSYAFSKLGETLQLEATVLPENATNPKVTWNSSNTAVATVSDNGLVTSVGNGTAAIAATADGIIEMCDISVDDNTINDICGNTYKYVKIGNQVWMAENMRCDKYDTESGRPGASITKYTSENPGSSTFAPYCADASEKNLWKSEDYVTEGLLPQIEKLGYLYNWAAAVGLEDESAAKGQTAPFDGNRQGICPNGWHVPTKAEWDALGVAIGGTKDIDGKFPDVGKKLKTTSGWYDSGNGTDDYTFAALPAGYASGSIVNYVGGYAYFWTSTPQGGETAIGYGLIYNEDFLYNYSSNKILARSVRCVKN